VCKCVSECVSEVGRCQFFVISCGEMCEVVSVRVVEWGGCDVMAVLYMT
jgi:hypothetical protein